MSEDIKRLIVSLQFEIQALALITNEALSVALSKEADPDSAVSLARNDLTRILDESERKAIDAEIGKDRKEFRKWFFAQVRESVAGKLDAIEKRVSRLTQTRRLH